MFRSISWLVSKSSSSSPNGLMISSPTYRVETERSFGTKSKKIYFAQVKHGSVSPSASRHRRRTAVGWKQGHTCPDCDPCIPSQGSEIDGQSRRRQRKSKLQLWPPEEETRYWSRLFFIFFFYQSVKDKEDKWPWNYIKNKCCWFCLVLPLMQGMYI